METEDDHDVRWAARKVAFIENYTAKCHARGRMDIDPEAAWVRHWRRWGWLIRHLGR